MKAKLITKNIQLLTPTLVPFDVRDTDLPGFLLRVLPSGGMTYFCDFRLEGRRTRIKLGDEKVLTPAQARDEAFKVLGDVARKIDPVAARRSARKETLEGFILKHYKPWAETHRKTGPQTVKRVRSRFADFKECQLTEISPLKVEKWRSARLKDGRKESTVNRNVTMLKAVLQRAVDWDIIESNPIAKIKPLKFDSSAKVRYLSGEEEAALRLALNQREWRLRSERRSYNVWCTRRGHKQYPDLDRIPFADHLKPMVLISINTGIRRGELFKLTWMDVDLAKRNLTIVGTTAKSGTTRHIPLNLEAFETLTSWRGQQTDSNGLVFPNADGGCFDNVNTSWEGVLSHGTIDHFRWHDMRHHFASRLVMEGVDLNTVRELLGHSDLKMTLRYAHLAPKVKADAVAKLDVKRGNVADQLADFPGSGCGTNNLST